MASNDEQLSIDNGPGKFDLMMGLFDNCNDSRRTVRFTVLRKLDIAFTVHVDITSVQREDGSGKSWNIMGYVVKDDTGIVSRANNVVAIYYNMRTRKGVLTYL